MAFGEPPPDLSRSPPFRPADARTWKTEICELRAVFSATAISGSDIRISNGSIECDWIVGIKDSELYDASYRKNRSYYLDKVLYRTDCHFNYRD